MQHLLLRVRSYVSWGGCDVAFLLRLDEGVMVDCGAGCSAVEDALFFL